MRSTSRLAPLSQILSTTCKKKVFLYDVVSPDISFFSLSDLTQRRKRRRRKITRRRKVSQTLLSSFFLSLFSCSLFFLLFVPCRTHFSLPFLTLSLLGGRSSVFLSLTSMMKGKDDASPPPQSTQAGSQANVLLTTSSSNISAANLSAADVRREREREEERGDE
jgi:hypothetical protein